MVFTATAVAAWTTIKVDLQAPAPVMFGGYVEETSLGVISEFSCFHFKIMLLFFSSQNFLL